MGTLQFDPADIGSLETATHAVIEAWIGHLKRLVFARYGTAVQAGPFAGMTYFAETAYPLPVLLGSYEAELHPAIERAVAAAPRILVNVGSAEGYYAVGLAMRLPQARVIAFEAHEALRARAWKVAAANRVAGRIKWRSACTAGDLAAALAEAGDDATLVVMDCEGCERTLLDPAAIPALRKAMILVEVHEFAEAGLTAKLAARFAASHSVEEIRAAARDPAAFPAVASLGNFLQAVALCEFRTMPGRWLAMTPHASRPVPSTEEAGPPGG